MPRAPWLLLLLSTLAFLPSAHAQEHWTSAFSLSVRGDLAIPTGDITRAVGHRVGYGFGAVLRYWPVQHLGIYAGWDRFEFRESTDLVASKLVDSGFRAGVEANLQPFGSRRVDPFAFGGLLWARTRLSRTDTTDATLSVRSGRDAGFEAGAGVRVPVGHGIWLIPEGRYRRHPADLAPLLAAAGRSHVSYFGVNLGLWFHL
ncbi:MAG TPA: hypothetical protein VFL93_01000 [Longimicrobiaceae bacterium]|nr:hypothetical protein [Longimicrobiaceae bacterium]